MKYTPHEFGGYKTKGIWEEKADIFYYTITNLTEKNDSVYTHRQQCEKHRSSKIN